ncbi:hypothetical protein E2562_037433 [Oryza meyeriana var. granulata]|uniref:Uncharacterized protein n=1 Tax=Oryza meyeriana var. granulata TaxID=110450 RepID=A0A6G1CLQ9_9ORYZ|nr:hypothetical protein E2562_037433 [Oryza meyeriana var. granulata]
MAMMMMTQSSGSSACRHPVSRSTAELHWCSQRRPSLPTTTVAALTKKPAVRCWSISSSLRDDSGRELVDEGMPLFCRERSTHSGTQVCPIQQSN